MQSDAPIEGNIISQRTKEALARKRAEGVRLGHPKGVFTDPPKSPAWKYHARMIALMIKVYGAVAVC